MLLQNSKAFNSHPSDSPRRNVGTSGDVGPGGDVNPRNNIILREDVVVGPRIH